MISTRDSAVGLVAAFGGYVFLRALYLALRRRWRIYKWRHRMSEIKGEYQWWGKP